MRRKAEERARERFKTIAAQAGGSCGSVESPRCRLRNRHRANRPLRLSRSRRWHPPPLPACMGIVRSGSMKLLDSQRSFGVRSPWLAFVLSWRGRNGAPRLRSPCWLGWSCSSAWLASCSRLRPATRSVRLPMGAVARRAASAALGHRRRRPPGLPPRRRSSSPLMVSRAMRSARFARSCSCCPSSPGLGRRSPKIGIAPTSTAKGRPTAGFGSTIRVATSRGWTTTTTAGRARAVRSCAYLPRTRWSSPDRARRAKQAGPRICRRRIRPGRKHRHRPHEHRDHRRGDHRRDVSSRLSGFRTFARADPEYLGDAVGTKRGPGSVKCRGPDGPFRDHRRPHRPASSPLAPSPPLRPTAFESR